ncbi:MAG TPA: hypothetical protein VNZ61_14055 [Roseomonas sp.]|nr:hypothetical protein [Roseomonas sp.]
MKLLICVGMAVASGAAALQSGMTSQDAVVVGLLLAAICAMFLFRPSSVARARPVPAARPTRVQPTPPSASTASATPPPATPWTDGTSPLTAASRLPVIEYVSASAIQNHPGIATASEPAWAPLRQPPATPPHAPPPAAAPNGAPPPPPFGSEGARGRFTEAEWNEKSFLKLTGYQVGTFGISAWRRQDILRRAYERPLPADMPATLRAECGAPGSSMRLQRIVRHLRFCSIALARPRAANMTKALSDWQADIAWLQATFGAFHRDVDFR